MPTTPVIPDELDLSTLILRFVDGLRSTAIPVSMVETLDAVDAVLTVDLAHRDHLRAALGCTLVKRAENRPMFDALFDIYFPVRRPVGDLSTSVDRPEPTEDGEGTPSQAGDGDGDGSPSTDLLDGLLEALRLGDDDALRALAAIAVGLFGGIDEDRGASERYYLFRILRQLDLSELLRQAVQRRRDDDDSLEARLGREELTARVEDLRRMIAEQLRWQLATVHGSDQTAQILHERPVEDLPFLHASPSELRQMREAIRPLVAKLAAKVARRRHLRRQGRLDVRRTMRRSLSAGGVPLDPVFRRRRASKPDLYLLCDISGSVAEFARFSMSLLYAMKGEFSRVRLFVFVDGVAEVTDRFQEGTDWLAPRNLLHGTDVVAADGHSDYGNVFRTFWHRYGHADLDPRSTLIITGDARNNYRDPGFASFRSIHERAHRVYWLNPEARSHWDTADSVMSAYAELCTAQFEVRNLRQLADFVVEIT